MTPCRRAKRIPACTIDTKETLSVHFIYLMRAEVKVKFLFYIDILHTFIRVMYVQDQLHDFHSCTGIKIYLYV